MQANKVVICGVDTSSLPVLSHEEMMALFPRIHDGDAQARELFIRGNLRLVLSVIQRFASRGENPDDLFQVGCIGLMKSIDHFDTSLNVRFSTYAVPMIIGEIRRYLRDNNALRVSRSLRDLAYHAFQVRDRLLYETGTEPTVEQIAQALDAPREDVILAMDAIQNPMSLSDPLYQDEGGDTFCVEDVVKDDKVTDDRWLESLALREAMARLSEREKKILYMRFFQGRTQMEVAEDIGISQAQVSRLEKGALRTMRKRIE